MFVFLCSREDSICLVWPCYGNECFVKPRIFYVKDTHIVIVCYERNDISESNPWTIETFGEHVNSWERISNANECQPYNLVEFRLPSGKYVFNSSPLPYVCDGEMISNDAHWIAWTGIFAFMWITRAHMDLVYVHFFFSSSSFSSVNFIWLYVRLCVRNIQLLCSIFQGLTN